MHHLRHFFVHWLVRLLLPASVVGGLLGLSTPAFPGQLSVWEQNRLTFSGIGPVRIGQTIGEASRALGFPLRGLTAKLDPECAYVWPKGDSKAPVAFMVRQGKIVRIDLRNATVRTFSGIGLGMTEVQVKAKYHPLSVQPHKYVQGGHTLIYRSSQAAYAPYAMVFETDGKKVTAIRAGFKEEAQWVEGCS